MILPKTNYSNIGDGDLVQISIIDLRPGTYILEIKTEEGTTT